MGTVITKYDVYCKMCFFSHITPRSNTIKHFGWFYYHNLKASSSNYDSFLSSFNLNCADIKNTSMEERSSEKLLGVSVKRNFKFEQQVDKSCRKGNQKLHALT